MTLQYYPLILEVVGGAVDFKLVYQASAERKARDRDENHERH